MNANTERRVTEPGLTDLCRAAVHELDAGCALPPLELGEEVDAAERAVVRVRDGLIARLRTGGDDGDARRWRQALQRVNMALSLIVGVEYPSIGVRRKPLEQASAALKEVLDHGWLE